jgi:hypothetical protein
MSYEVEQKWSQDSYLKGVEFLCKAENCWSIVVILQTLLFFNCALWYTYVITTKTHTFYINILI